MPAQTNDRDIPVRKADVDATTAAVTALGVGLPLPTGAATSAKQDTQITAEGAIKTAVELLDDSVATVGAAIPAKGLQATGSDGTLARALRVDADGHPQVDVLSSVLPTGAATSAVQTDGTQKAMAMGVEGATQRQVAVDASARLLVAQPTAADLNVTEASAASILAKLDVALSTRALEAGGNLAAIATAAGKLADDRKLIPYAFSAAAVVDGSEVELTGFTALAHYTLLQFNSTPHTGGGIATHRQRRLYRATGGAVADLCWEEPTDLAVASGVFYPFSQLGNVIKADAAGKIWLRYEVTGGGSITETGDLYFFPLRTA